MIVDSKRSLPDKSNKKKQDLIMQVIKLGDWLHIFNEKNISINSQEHIFSKFLFILSYKYFLITFVQYVTK